MSGIIYYFTPCCDESNPFGIQNNAYNAPENWLWFEPNNTTIGYYLSVGPFSGCVTYSGSSQSVLPNITLYDLTPIVNDDETDCVKCTSIYPCNTPPPVVTPIISGQLNECGVITIMPMEVECVSSNPSSYGSSDGEVSVSITGGTPPYTVSWSSSTDPSIGIHPALYNMPNDTYAATVVDFYGDFTVTVYCTIETPKDCTFSASIVEFFLPTPTPTMTPTMTMTPTPSPPPTPLAMCFQYVGINFPNPFQVYLCDIEAAPTLYNGRNYWVLSICTNIPECSYIDVGVVWWNSSTSLWYHSITLGSTAPFEVFSTLNNPGNYPVQIPGTYEWINLLPLCTCCPSIIDSNIGLCPQPSPTPTPTYTPTPSPPPTFAETFTMIARVLTGLGQFRIDSSLPFRVVWDVANNIYTDYPAGVVIIISHTYPTPYTGNILIKSNDLSSITIFQPFDVTPIITNTSVRYLEIETSQINLLDGLLTMGTLGNSIGYFLSGDISNLPPTLIQLAATYSNCSGDIINLPPNLQYFWVNGFNFNTTNQINTITGNVANLPGTLTTITLGGSNTLSGNIQAVPSSVVQIIISGLNVIAGNIGLMSTFTHPNLNRIYIWGNNTISGDLGGISDSVTDIDLQGKNFVTGDIATLPPNLNSLIVLGISPGGNTLYGNISTFTYSTLNTIKIHGNNTISGNISSLNLKFNATFDIDGNNTITGNISTLGVPNTNNLITINGDNTIFGNIQNLPTNAANIEIGGNNVISGDLSLVNLTTSGLVIRGNNTITTFSNPNRVFSSLGKIIILSNVSGVGFDSSNIDRLLTSYANSTWGGVSKQLQLRGISTPKYTNTVSYNILTGPTKQVGITLL
jgi:hypothetical protein